MVMQACMAPLPALCLCPRQNALAQMCHGHACRHCTRVRILAASQRVWAAQPASAQVCPASFSPATKTMELFMWQRNTVGVGAHYVMDCSVVLGALDDA